jgi:hypothetical protein
MGMLIARRCMPGRSIAIVPVALAMLSSVAVAGSVPSYDIEPTCRSVARAAEAPRKDAEKCIADEHGLRDQLAREWSTFHATDRARCVRRLALAWRPTYTELITCLEIAQALRNLPEQLSPDTVRATR